MLERMDIQGNTTQDASRLTDSATQPHQLDSRDERTRQQLRDFPRETAYQRHRTLFRIFRERSGVQPRRSST